MQVKIEALRQTLAEAATACNEALPPRIKAKGGVCQVSLEIGSGGHPTDRLRVVLTLDGGYQHTVTVGEPNGVDPSKMAVDCVGLLEIWFDVNADDFGPSGGGPGVRLRKAS